MAWERPLKGVGTATSTSLGPEAVMAARRLHDTAAAPQTSRIKKARAKRTAAPTTGLSSAETGNCDVTIWNKGWLPLAHVYLPQAKSQAQGPKA